jgi:hypothetical protein
VPFVFPSSSFVLTLQDSPNRTTAAGKPRSAINRALRQEESFSPNCSRCTPIHADASSESTGHALVIAKGRHPRFSCTNEDMDADLRRHHGVSRATASAHAID